MLKFSTTIAYQHDSVFSPFKADEFDDALEWASAADLDGIELVISDYSEIPSTALVRLKTRLDGCGLSVSTISTGGAYRREGLCLLAPEPDIRDAAFRRVCQHIDAARILGSKVTIGIFRGAGRASALEEEMEWLRTAFARIDTYAAAHGVMILLEPINRYEVTLLHSLPETVTFLESIPDIRSMKVVWDLFHANIEDLDFGKEIGRHSSWLGHVHLADSNRAFPGYGRTDFQAIFKSLALHGFDGYVSFECLNSPDIETVKAETKEFVRKSRANLLRRQV